MFTSLYRYIYDAHRYSICITLKRNLKQVFLTSILKIIQTCPTTIQDISFTNLDQQSQGDRITFENNYNPGSVKYFEF